MVQKLNNNCYATQIAESFRLCCATLQQIYTGNVKVHTLYNHTGIIMLNNLYKHTGIAMLHHFYKNTNNAMLQNF